MPKFYSKGSYFLVFPFWTIGHKRVKVVEKRHLASRKQLPFSLLSHSFCLLISGGHCNIVDGFGGRSDEVVSHSAGRESRALGRWWDWTGLVLCTEGALVAPVS